MSNTPIETEAGGTEAGGTEAGRCVVSSDSLPNTQEQVKYIDKAISTRLKKRTRKKRVRRHERFETRGLHASETQSDVGAAHCLLCNRNGWFVCTLTMTDDESKAYGALPCRTMVFYNLCHSCGANQNVDQLVEDKLFLQRCKQDSKVLAV